MRPGQLLPKNLVEILESGLKIGLYGASGHAKVIIDLAGHQGHRIVTIFDDNPQVTQLMGYPVVHQFEAAYYDLSWIIAIGSNKVRQLLASKYPLNFLKLIHPRAVVDGTVSIGLGTVVMAGAVINADSVIGQHVIVNTGACVDHDCKIGDFCHIAPNTTLCGGVTVGEGALIGAGAVIIPGITLGHECTVGAGAVVVKDVPPGVVVAGNPAKVISPKTN